MYHSEIFSQKQKFQPMIAQTEGEFSKATFYNSILEEQ